LDNINRENSKFPQDEKRNKWRAGLVYFVILLIFGFLIQKILDNWSQVLEIGVTFQPDFLSLSVILLFSYFFLLTLLWHLITKSVGITLSLKENIYYWFLSQLGKYVPGKIVSIMSRSYFYKKKGFRISLTVSAFLLETLAGIISISLLSVILIAHYVTRELLYLIPILLFTLFLFYPQTVELMVNLLNRILGRQPIVLGVKMKDWLLLNFLYGLNFFLLAGGAFLFFCKSILDFNGDGEQTLFLIGSLGLSGVLGIIAFFTPSGLGIREASLFFLLSKIMPEAEAAVIAVSSRVWLMCSELILIGIIYCIFHLRDIFSKWTEH